MDVANMHARCTADVSGLMVRVCVGVNRHEIKNTLEINLNRR